MPSPDEMLRTCALGEAAWHRVAYLGLDTAWYENRDLAWGVSPPHRFLLAAVTLSPTPVLPPLEGIVCDSWGALDLQGWTREVASPWMYREPGPCEIQGEVEQTDQALLFEATAFLAAGGSLPDRPGELHPTADLPGLRLFLARRDGQPVGRVSGRHSLRPPSTPHRTFLRRWPRASWG